MLQGISRQRLASANDEPSQSENTNPGPFIASRLPAPVLFGYALPEHRVPSTNET